MTESTASPPKFDETKQPGISFLGVNLIKLEFDMGPKFPEKLQYGPSFENETEFSEDGSQLTYTMHVDLFGAVPEESIPYLRELVANVTTRSPLPTLNFGPINIGALMKGTSTKLELRQSKKPAQNT